jgi:hypothetical protein
VSGTPPISHVLDIGARFRSLAEGGYLALRPDVWHSFALHGPGPAHAALAAPAPAAAPAHVAAQWAANVTKYAGKLATMISEWRNKFRATKEATAAARAFDELCRVHDVIMAIAARTQKCDVLTRTYPGDPGLVFDTDAEYWRSAVVPAAKSESHALEELVLLYAAQALSFPFKCLTLPDPHRLLGNIAAHKAQWDTVSEVRPHNVRFRSTLLPLVYLGSTEVPAASSPGFLSIYHDDSDYVRMDALMDHFTERQRLTAKRADEKLSPLERWRAGTAGGCFFCLFVCLFWFVFF